MMEPAELEGVDVPPVNTNGTKPCKVFFTSTPGENDDVGYINSFLYLKHEFKQAEKRNKKLLWFIIFYEKNQIGFLLT